MLFLLKRTWMGSLLGLAVLAGLGLILRRYLGDVPPVIVSSSAVLAGIVAVALILTSDCLLHGILCLVFGLPYQRRHRELAALFNKQTLAAILAGATMAGLGEELVFRGLSTSPFYLVPAAVLFGLLHHVRASLWLFTIWSIWQGLLIAGAFWWTGNLFVTIEAHFCHDLLGFLIFRRLNRLAPLPDPGTI